MRTFKQHVLVSKIEWLDDENQEFQEFIEPSELDNHELAAAHNILQECDVNTHYWQELDEVMNHRCEEGDMEWPYK